MPSLPNTHAGFEANTDLTPDRTTRRDEKLFTPVDVTFNIPTAVAVHRLSGLAPPNLDAGGSKKAGLVDGAAGGLG